MFPFCFCWPGDRESMFFDPNIDFKGNLKKMFVFDSRVVFCLAFLGFRKGFRICWVWRNVFRGRGKSLHAPGSVLELGDQYEKNGKAWCRPSFETVNFMRLMFWSQAGDNNPAVFSSKSLLSKVYQNWSHFLIMKKWRVMSICSLYIKGSNLGLGVSALSPLHSKIY